MRFGVGWVRPNTSQPGRIEPQNTARRLASFGVYFANMVELSPLWREHLTEADWHGLTPLFYRHINPYGRFDLDMSYRVPLVA